MNLQNYYVKEVKASAGKIVNDCYNSIENHQTKLFEKMQGDLQEMVKKMREELSDTSLKCNQAAKRAEESAEKMTSLREWRDFLQWASPIAVFLNLVWLVFTFFAGR